MIEFINHQSAPLFQALCVHASITCLLFIFAHFVLKIKLPGKDHQSTWIICKIIKDNLGYPYVRSRFYHVKNA